MSSKQMTRHHLVPKSRTKGRHTDQEVCDMKNTTVRLWCDRHMYWHVLFGNLNIVEIIEVLERLKRMKTKKSKQWKDT